MQHQQQLSCGGQSLASVGTTIALDNLNGFDELAKAKAASPVVDKVQKSTTSSSKSKANNKGSDD